ncbi:MAG: LCP family protein [Anaerolineales bacterium]
MKPAAQAAALTLILTACGAMAKAQVGGPLLPKAAQDPSAPTAAVPLAITVVPLPTLAPILPAVGLTPWPPPYTYGSGTPPPTAVPPPAEPYAFDDDVMNILLLGSDRRGGSGASRTDVILLLSLHPSRSGAALVSIPRDLYVYLPGYTMGRVNTAWVFGDQLRYPGGGQAMLADTLLYNLGVRVDHYALVDMEGFRQIIDSVGGVDVPVACPYTDWRLKRPDLNQNDPDNWALYTVTAGEQHMDGYSALWYARSRSRSSDFDRSRRQHEVLRSFYRKSLGLGWLLHLPDVWASLNRLVTTDMGLGDLLLLAPQAARIDLGNLRSRFINRQQVTGWRTPSGAAVLLPRPNEVRALLDDAFNFEAVDPTQPRTTTTVEVIGHPDHADWAGLAAERLVYAGFSAYPAEPEGDAPRNSILVEAHTGDPALRERLRAALGLGAASLVLQPEPSAPFPYRLVLGDDYRPCFDPSRFRSNAPPPLP